VGLPAAWSALRTRISFKVQLKVTKVAGNIYLLEGDGAGNIGASVGDDGIVILD
jgi:hypothetical protein